jgi:hypothetical protein
VVVAVVLSVFPGVCVFFFWGAFVEFGSTRGSGAEVSGEGGEPPPFSVGVADDGVAVPPPGGGFVGFTGAVDALGEPPAADVPVLPPLVFEAVSEVGVSENFFLSQMPPRVNTMMKSSETVRRSSRLVRFRCGGWSGSGLGGVGGDDEATERPQPAQ